MVNHYFKVSCYLLEFPKNENCHDEGDQTEGVPYEIDSGGNFHRRTNIIVELPARAVIRILVPSAITEAKATRIF